jgi:prepilin-type N-terminal cleavage/methylation domain-containing protein/prepilin-type processing-associated H-X9-DG protein
MNTGASQCTGSETDSSPPPCSASAAPRCGFTLVELLVVIAIIAVLAGLLLPVLSKGKARAQTVDCIDHLRQLQLCFDMYAHDNDNNLVLNNFVYNVTMGSTTPPSLGIDKDSWCHSIAPLDPNPVNSTNSLLFDYNRNPAIYHCPADTSTVIDKPGLLRNRSFNMSNCINLEQADHFTKESDIHSPSTLFVFIDTDADEITDPTFGVIPIGDYFQNYWLDIPADRHNTRGCNLTFADGHVETWKWKTPKGGRLAGSATISDDDLDDLRRLQNCLKGAGGN